MKKYHVVDYRAERRMIRSWLDSDESIKCRLKYFSRLAASALDRPWGFVQRIVWSQADGCAGYVQHSVRPYIPGQGCDGTTDQNIHLCAAQVCRELGIDYAAIVHAARLSNGEQQPLEYYRRWVDVDLLGNEELARETCFASASDPDRFVLLIGDLREINARSIALALASELRARLSPQQSTRLDEMDYQGARRRSKLHFERLARDGDSRAGRAPVPPKAARDRSVLRPPSGSNPAGARGV